MMQRTRLSRAFSAQKALEYSETESIDLLEAMEENSVSKLGVIDSLSRQYQIFFTYLATLIAWDLPSADGSLQFRKKRLRQVGR